MPEKELKKYKYIAFDSDRNRVTGLMLAESETDLRELLIESELYLVKSRVSADSAITFFSVSSHVKIGEITTFCRQFAIMLNAGINISEALDTLKKQPYSSLFKRALSLVQADVREGKLLSDALRSQNKIFPDLFVSMTYVGEMSGTLGKILNELAEYYEKDNAIKRKAKSAMVYPTVLAVMTLAIVLIMFVFVIPTFESTLSSLDVELPALTRSMIAFSDFLTGNWETILISAAGIVLALCLLTRLEPVKFFGDYLKTKLPILKNVTVALVSSRFARGFGALMSGGVNAVDAMYIMGKILGNRFIEKKFRLALADVEAGLSMSEAFSKHGVFPDMLIQMIAVGESTGSLDDVITKTAFYFDDRVDSALSTMTSLLEPMIIVIMGIVIALIILSVFMPLLAIMQQL